MRAVTLRWSVVSLLTLLLFLICRLADAQDQRKIPRIGMLRHGSPPDPLVDAFRRGLRELGYSEGTSLVLELRWTGGDTEKLRGLAAELVQAKVDILVTPGVAVTRAAAQATKTIPLVITAVPDPVGEGFVASLSHPAGNITGLSSISPDLSGKRLEMLKEAFPPLTRTLVLWTGADEGGQVHATQVAAKALGLRVQLFEARNRIDIENAFSGAKERVEAYVVLGSGILFENRRLLIDLAANNRRPVVYPHRGFVEPGGLMSYGPDFPDLFRRAAVYVDKILKGAKPASLPVEQPTKFELVINLKAAKQIGLSVPPAVLARADRVIR
jgi:putative ABC transport system substrate-binding protein